MRIIKSIRTLRSAVKKYRSQKKRIGFVPTMGALHEGHLTLIRKSRRENGVTAISIFVNPKQFGPKENFASYPRPEKNDILLAKKEKVDIIFYPSEMEMYPTSFLTSIQVDKISGLLCGQSRPGHFRGVTTVVGKLLNAVTPDVLYLGQKDAQQAVIIKHMVRDLNFPVAVKVCPIVRERDGLAISSRNALLSRKHRKEAPVLFQSLLNAQRMIKNGERAPQKILQSMRAKITKHSSGAIDYTACVDAKTLMPMRALKGSVLIAIAVKFGKIRLIDNLIVHIK